MNHFRAHLNTDRRHIHRRDAQNVETTHQSKVWNTLQNINPPPYQSEQTDPLPQTSKYLQTSFDLGSINAVAIYRLLRCLMRHLYHCSEPYVFCSSLSSPSSLRFCPFPRPATTIGLPNTRHGAPDVNRYNGLAGLVSMSAQNIRKMSAPVSLMPDH